MKVPAVLMKNTDEWIGKQIFITKYVEQMPTKLYTEVKENLLVMVLKGKKHLVYQDFETTIHEGQFALFKKGNYIMNQILSKEGYESLLIFLSDELLRSVPRIAIQSTYENLPYFKGNTIPYMEKEAVSLLELMKAPKEYSDIIKLKVIELLIYVQKADTSGSFQALLSSYNEQKSFKEEVTLYYEQYSSVEQLATAMHMSTSTFKRRFQENFKCTPHLWINHFQPLWHPSRKNMECLQENIGIINKRTPQGGPF